MDPLAALYRDIGARVHRARLKSGLSQEKLGKKVGLLRTSISNIETGKQRVPLHQLYRIAAELAVPVHELLPEELPGDHDFETIFSRISGLTDDERAWVLETWEKGLKKSDG